MSYFVELHASSRGKVLENFLGVIIKPNRDLNEENYPKLPYISKSR